MDTKTHQQLLTEFFGKYSDLLNKKPSSRKRGHFTKLLLRRRKRNKIAKETRRKQK